MLVLGIETSCDDTSLALYSSTEGLLAECTSSQIVHEIYGGVVPEIASRAHMKTLLPVLNEALDRSGCRLEDLDGIGVSNGPGLIGSLLVGTSFAKALALGLGVPLVGVHHIESHIFANELRSKPLFTPSLVLVVSGGHTVIYHISKIGCYDLVGTTRDDAAGEAFDKIAKLLSLGYPGGPVIERIAKKGNGEAVRFPRAMMREGDFDFSFSGLKTAVRLHIEKIKFLDQQRKADIAASAQEAIVEVLVKKTTDASKFRKVPYVYMAGGVAANGRLRESISNACRKNELRFHVPPTEFCTDNGAMVACAAEKHLSHGRDDGFDLDVFARGEIKSWNC